MNEAVKQAMEEVLGKPTQETPTQETPASTPNEVTPTPAARPDNQNQNVEPNSAIQKASRQVLDQRVTRAQPDAEPKKSAGGWLNNAWKSFWRQLDDVRKANLGGVAEDIMEEISYNAPAISVALKDALALEAHYRIRTGMLFQDSETNETLANMKKERRKAYQKLMEEAPTLGSMFWESYSVWGDDEKVLNTLYEDPFRILTTLLPYSKYLKGVQGKGKLAKTMRGVGTVAPHLDPTELPFTVGGTLGKAVARWKNRGLAKGEYNVPFHAVYGRTMKGDAVRDLRVKQTPVEMAERIGVGKDDSPALVLSDSPTVHHNEMMRQQTGGAGAVPVTSRFEKSQQGIQNAFEDIETREIISARTLRPDVVNNVFDIEEVGKAYQKLYGEWQEGKRSQFNTTFGNIGAVLDRELRIDTNNFTLLGKTRAELDRLKKDHSKLSGSPRQSIQLAEQTLTEAFNNLSLDGLTLRDFDLYRTEFRQKFEDAIHTAGLKPVGSGDPVTRLYSTLTEDFYDLVETEVALNPSDFPQGFADSVQLAKKEYADVMRLEKTKAAEFLRNNMERPHYIVSNLLNKNTSAKFVNDMKTILGDEGWDLLKPGLLISFFDKVNGKTANFRWGGLKAEIASLNYTDKNRLRTVFGDDLAMELSALGEYAQRFSKEARWTKGTPTGFVNKLVQSPSFLSLIHNIANVLPFLTIPSGIRSGMGSANLTDAVVVAGLTSAFVGERMWDRFLNSDASRKWMLEGHSWDVVKKDGTVITITPEDFKLANDYIVVPFLKENKFVSKAPIRAGMRTQRAAARGDRERKKMKALPSARNVGGNPFRIPVE